MCRSPIAGGRSSSKEPTLVEWRCSTRTQTSPNTTALLPPMSQLARFHSTGTPVRLIPHTSYRYTTSIDQQAFLAHYSKSQKPHFVTKTGAKFDFEGIPFPIAIHISCTINIDHSPWRSRIITPPIYAIGPLVLGCESEPGRSDVMSCMTMRTH
jgi:hypothetical protein